MKCKFFTLHSSLFTLLLLTVAMITSCSNDNDITLPDPSIDFIQTTEVTFDGLADGQVKTISFNAPATWVAEIHQTGAWLKADVLRGNAGTATITLTPRNDNFGVTSRQATLEIHIDGYQPYIIKVEQKSAATGDIIIDGHINDGVMDLISDSKGTVFSDTIYVTSTKAWQLSVDPSSEGILSFDTDETPQNGTEKRIRVIVSADYSRFTTPSFTGKFYVKTNEGTAVPITVNAVSKVSVYENSRPRINETERTSYEMVDSIQPGVFQTQFYIDSNVRWIIDNKISWIETSADWGETAQMPTNLKSNGNIEKNRCTVALKVKTSELSATGKSCALNITDVRGQVLKTINIVFAGAGSSYINHNLAFPGSDATGNPWALEAKKSTVEETGPANRHRIGVDFKITTFSDYSSINDAPYHLLLVDGTNGIVRKKEVHWATLKMGDKSEQSSTANGMYTKQIIIEANERGDADDQNKTTTQSEMRHAFVYIVPRSVLFSDLWTSDGRLKDNYANNLVLMSQKNDPDAGYTFAFDGVADGSNIGNINPAGESKSFNITKGSYKFGDFKIEVKQTDGSWMTTDACSITVKTDDNDNPINATLTFKENKAERNPFTQQLIGSPRDFRISFNAFIGDEAGSKVIYTIYAHQELNK